jgi:hypothetical protein
MRVRSIDAVLCRPALRQRQLHVRREQLRQRVLRGQHLHHALLQQLRNFRSGVLELRCDGRQLREWRVPLWLGRGLRRRPAMRERQLRVQLEQLPDRLLQREPVPRRQHPQLVRRGRWNLSGLRGGPDLHQRSVQRLHLGQLPQRVLLGLDVHHCERERVRQCGQCVRLVRHDRRQLRGGLLQVRGRRGVRRGPAMRRRRLRVQRDFVSERLLLQQHVRGQQHGGVRLDGQRLRELLIDVFRQLHQRRVSMRIWRGVRHGPAVCGRQLRVQHHVVRERLLRRNQLHQPRDHRVRQRRQRVRRLRNHRRQLRERLVPLRQQHGVRERLPLQRRNVHLRRNVVRQRLLLGDGLHQPGDVRAMRNPGRELPGLQQRLVGQLYQRRVQVRAECCVRHRPALRDGHLPVRPRAVRRLLLRQFVHPLQHAEQRELRRRRSVHPVPAAAHLQHRQRKLLRVEQRWLHGGDRLLLGNVHRRVVPGVQQRGSGVRRGLLLGSVVWRGWHLLPGGGQQLQPGVGLLLEQLRGRHLPECVRSQRRSVRVALAVLLGSVRERGVLDVHSQYAVMPGQLAVLLGKLSGPGVRAAGLRHGEFSVRHEFGLLHQQLQQRTVRADVQGQRNFLRGFVGLLFDQLPAGRVSAAAGLFSEHGRLWTKFAMLLVELQRRPVPVHCRQLELLAEHPVLLEQLREQRLSAGMLRGRLDVHAQLAVLLGKLREQRLREQLQRPGSIMRRRAELLHRAELRKQHSAYVLQAGRNFVHQRQHQRVLQRSVSQRRVSGRDVQQRGSIVRLAEQLLHGPELQSTHQSVLQGGERLVHSGQHHRVLQRNLHRNGRVPWWRNLQQRGPIVRLAQQLLHRADLQSAHEPVLQSQHEHLHVEQRMLQRKLRGRLLWLTDVHAHQRVLHVGGAMLHGQLRGHAVQSAVSRERQLVQRQCRLLLAKLRSHHADLRFARGNVPGHRRRLHAAHSVLLSQLSERYLPVSGVEHSLHAEQSVLQHDLQLLHATLQLIHGFNSFSSVRTAAAAAFCPQSSSFLRGSSLSFFKPSSAAGFRSSASLRAAALRVRQSLESRLRT